MTIEEKIEALEKRVAELEARDAGPAPRYTFSGDADSYEAFRKAIVRWWEDAALADNPPPVC